MSAMQPLLTRPKVLAVLAIVPVGTLLTIGLTDVLAGWLEMTATFLLLASALVLFVLSGRAWQGE